MSKKTQFHVFSENVEDEENVTYTYLQGLDDKARAEKFLSDYTAEMDSPASITFLVIQGEVKRVTAKLIIS